MPKKKQEPQTVFECAKLYYATQSEAERALVVARRQWMDDNRRALRPPIRVYYCKPCQGWHLTSQEAL